MAKEKYLSKVSRRFRLHHHSNQLRNSDKNGLNKKFLSFPRVFEGKKLGMVQHDGNINQIHKYSMQLAYVIIYEAHTTTYYHLIHKQFMQNYMKRYERHYVIF